MGILSNFFIIFLHFFKHRESVSGSDKIIVALSFSNACFASIAFTNIFIFYFWPLMFVTHHLALVMFFIIIFIFTTSSWLTASLCFFYYVKIKTFTSSIMSHLKMKVSSLVPWMIFVSVVLSCFSPSLTIVQLLVDKDPSGEIPAFHSINVSQSYTTSSGVFRDTLYSLFICSFIPFLISAVTTASTAFSLLLHRLKLRKKKTPSSSNHHVKKYQYTIRILIRLLIFYAMIYVVLFLFYFNIFAAYSIGFWGFLVIMCSYSLTQSVLLSLATKKLKQAWMKIFHLGTDSRKADESREE